MLSDNLIMLRNIHGLSQEEVVEKIDISRQAYGKWESGKTIPDIEKCSRLAELYGVTLDSLVRKEQLEDGKVLVPAPKGKNIWGSVTINERGQVVIPKAARDLFKLVPGQRLILLSEVGEGYALVPAEMFEKRMEEIRNIVLNKNQ